MGSLGIIAFGAGLVLYGLSVTYGVVGRNWKRTQRARAAYAYRAPSISWSAFSPARIIVMMPFFGLAAMFVGIAGLLPRDLRPVITVLMTAALGVFIVGFVAFLWPRPFLPAWAKEADDRIKAGLPPTMAEPEELAQGRRMTKRQWTVGHLVLAAAVFGNLVLDIGPSNLVGPLLMGWAFWGAAQARAARSPDT